MYTKSKTDDAKTQLVNTLGPSNLAQRNCPKIPIKKEKYLKPIKV